MARRLPPDGVNFSVTASDAERVDLCLFDAEGGETRLALPESDGGIWHGFVPGVRPGQAYGYRVSGPYDPDKGLGPTRPSSLSIPTPAPLRDRDHLAPRCSAIRRVTTSKPSDLDSASHVPRSLVVDSSYEWRHPRPSRRYADTVFYELHVKGFTMRHPGVPEELRGTYAGLAHEAALSHLVDLGVTAVELLPVHESVPEAFLIDRGLTQLLGLQHHRLLRCPTSATPRRCEQGERVDRCSSSSGWSMHSTGPGSR